jgi:hypothetical protein
MNQVKFYSLILLVLLSCSKASTTAPKDIVFKTILYDNHTIKTFSSTTVLTDTIKLNLNDSMFNFITALLMYIPPSTVDYSLGVGIIARENKLDFGYYTSGTSTQIKIKNLNKGDDISPDNITWYSNRGSTTIANPNFVCSYTNAAIPGGGIKLFDILDKEEAYIPFRFKMRINGVEDWRYGWVRCKITINSITIYDYAYNKNTNQNIAAGEK